MFHPRVGLRSAALVLALAASGSVPGAVRAARADDAPPAPVPAAKPAVLLPDTEVPVTDVLAALAKATGVTIGWSEQDKLVNIRKVVGAGTLFARNPDALFDAVRALLANDEIVLVPYGPGASRMYRAADVRQLQSQFMLKAQPEVIEVTEAMVPLLLGQGGRFVTTTIHVRNLTELREARTGLARLVTQNNVGSVTEVPAARAFIVTDFAPNVAAIYRMIRQMDVAPQATEPVVPAPAYFPLAHANAQSVAILLDRLFPARTAGPSIPPRTTPDPAAPAVPPSPAPRISFDEATNQIVVIATPEDTKSIRDIVEHVDVLTLPRK